MKLSGNHTASDALTSYRPILYGAIKQPWLRSFRLIIKSSYLRRNLWKMIFSRS